MEETGVPVLPFRTEDVPLNKALRYYIGSVHWLDAVSSPLEGHLQRLVEHVKARLPAPAEPVRDQAKNFEPAVGEITAKPEDIRPPVEIQPEKPNAPDESTSEATATPPLAEKQPRTAAKDDAPQPPRKIPPISRKGSCAIIVVIGVFTIVSIIFLSLIVSEKPAPNWNRYPSTPTPSSPSPAVTPAPMPVSKSLAGTIWDWKDSRGNTYTYEYQQGGTLRATNTKTNAVSTGSWSQSGNQATVTFSGTYKEIGTISGTQMNGQGDGWTWSATENTQRETNEKLFSELFGSTILGTTWKGSDADDGKDRIYKFQANNRVQMIVDGTTYEGTWTQSGSSIVMKINGYSRQADIKGDVMEGLVTLSSGKTTKWSAKKQS